MEDKTDRYYPKKLSDILLYGTETDESLKELHRMYLNWARTSSDPLKERLRYMRSVILLDKEIKHTKA